MAIDRDGTQGYIISSVGAVSQLTNAQLVTLNNENNDSVTVSGQAQTTSLFFIFPELRDLDAYFFANGDSASSVSVLVSTNTTNGIDGTWTTITAGHSESTKAVVPNYRTGITSTTALAIRAVKFTAAVGNAEAHAPRAIHLYGEPAPGENPNRLAIWHPTLDQRVTPAYFDWGNVPRSSSADLTFRVKNLSATLTAGSVRVAMEASSDTTPSVPGQHSLSTDGTTFLAQVNIGSLAPGAISAPLTLRRVTPSNAVLSLWSMRLFAESTTAWT